MGGRWYPPGVAVLERDVFTAPLYTKAEAARIVDVPGNTFRNWSDGYWYMTTSGERATPGLITVALENGRVKVPFVGLAEAYVIVALKDSGIPMVRIRPAVTTLRQGMGIRYALLSERLKTDGVEVLYEFVGDESEASDGRVGLAVVRNRQLVFREAIEQYLKTITYEDGFATSFMPRRFGEKVVRIDPRVNAGQPSFVRTGVRVSDVLSRVRSGEAIDEIADDFDLSSESIRHIQEVA